MKKYIALLFVFAFTIGCFYSCKKDYNKRVADYVPNFSSYSFLKVINGTVGATRNYVYQDALNQPLNGSPMSISTTTGYYPMNSTYAALYQGNRTIILKDTSSTSKQTTVTYTGNFTAGNYYTLFTYDTITGAKYVLVQDTIQHPTDTTSRIRFANLIYSSTPIPNVDLYSARLGANIFTNVPVGQVTSFVPFQSGQRDTLYVRPTGTTTNLASSPSIPGISGSAPFVPTAGRSYTVVFEGRYQTAPDPNAKTTTANTLSASNPVRSVIIYTNY